MITHTWFFLFMLNDFTLLPATAKEGETLLYDKLRLLHSWKAIIYSNTSWSFLHKCLMFSPTLWLFPPNCWLLPHSLCMTSELSWLSSIQLPNCPLAAAASLQRSAKHSSSLLLLSARWEKSAWCPGLIFTKKGVKETLTCMFPLCKRHKSDRLKMRSER